MNHGTPELRITAPANLLLVGEYAVTEEGGLGIGIAVEIRATLVRRDGPSRLRGILPGGSIEYPGGGGRFGAMAQHLWGENLPAALGDVTIDTRAFFESDGAKLGLGSSAALAVLLAACSFLPRHASTDEVFERALETHRKSQGGAGSGYDIACASYGGVVLFTGGARPGVRPIDLPWLPAMRLHRGAAPVETRGAVDRYVAWRNSDVSRADAYVDRSNELVRAICAASSWSEGGDLIREYARHAIDLGEEIGVPAGPTCDADLAKCVGAGNELAVSFDLEDDSTGAVGRPLVIAKDGLRWV